MAGCSDLAPNTGGGLVCLASIPLDETLKPEDVKIEVPAFSVPLSAQGDVSAMATATVSGLVQYQKYSPASTGPGNGKIDYATPVTSHVVRRAIVQIMNGTTPIASGMTDDGGNYSISVTASSGTPLFVRVLSRSTAAGYVSDGLGSNSCSGGGWDVRVVNNVTGNSASQTNAALRPTYALDSSTFAMPASGTVPMNLMAEMDYSGSSYQKRAGAPFVLLDTAISGLETACQGRANITFPTLYMNWSENNAAVAGNRYQGDISTSFFTTETSARTANLYILGKAGSDTDELDTHVVAHEFAHFLENKIYRSDSIGGRHSLSDSLDPRLAFGEGFGNAFSGIVLSDPLYIDTSGPNQASGFSISIDQVPASDDDRGPWSERSVQYMIYSLWDAQDGIANSGSFDRIHNVLETYQKPGSASTNILTFTSYYAQVYGQTDGGLGSLWSLPGFLNSPLAALCDGSCVAGTPVYSPWDSDNDLGFAYTGSRNYRQGTTNKFPADFWRLYRPLVSGTNAATEHDRISFGGYTAVSDNLNKFGLRRLYKVTATGAQTTVSVASITQGTQTCSSGDLLDMGVYSKGVLIGLDEAQSGATSNCPSVTFCSTPGQTYIVEIAGFGTVGAYSLSVSP